MKSGFAGDDHPTILAHIRAHLDPGGCGLLPGGDELPGEVTEGEFRWAAGARDGVGSHHFGAGTPDVDVDEVVGLMGRVIGREFRPTEFGALYERIRTVRVLPYVDTLLAAVRDSALPPSGVHELGRRLASDGRHVEPVKFGIALLGMVRGREDRDLLLTLGRHEELTLYCAVAIVNSDPDPETALWSLARGVNGWGRVQTVERLRDTERAEIQDWLVREGFRNSVMDEYLAYIAATTGRLLDRLTAGDPDDQLLEAAGQIISALITGGPAEDIDDYADAPRLLSVFTGLMSERARELMDFVVVDDIAGFLRGDDGWDDRPGWPQDQRRQLLASCEQITSWPSWPPLAVEGLESDDDRLFWYADRAAKALGLDTFGAHWRRLCADPVHGNWYAVMQQADDQRIEQIIELATRTLPLDALGTGPGTLHGLGPEFAAQNALGFILQDLGRFPGHGWPLVETGLRSPVIRVRNMAVNALGHWPLPSWPPQARSALAEAARAEPNERTRERMNEVLAQFGG